MLQYRFASYPNRIKKKYTFDNFVSGDGNQWLWLPLLAVSENLATTYNPLFIYGGPGLGKRICSTRLGIRLWKLPKCSE